VHSELPSRRHWVVLLENVKELEPFPSKHSSRRNPTVPTINRTRSRVSVFNSHIRNGPQKN
jgi:hypothetical protein